MVGLVSPNFGLGGLDGPLHLSEDTFDPIRTVPLSIVISIVMGCVSAVAFIVAMLYCVTDISALVTSRTGYDVCIVGSIVYILMVLQRATVRAVVSSDGLTSPDERFYGSIHWSRSSNRGWQRFHCFPSNLVLCKRRRPAWVDDRRKDRPEATSPRECHGLQRRLDCHVRRCLRSIYYRYASTTPSLDNVSGNLARC